MTVATPKLLTALHGRLASAMDNALDAEINRIAATQRLYDLDFSELDEGTAKVVTQALTLAPAARVDNGLLKTVAGFLKDNSITADLSEAEGEDETQMKLKALQAKRRVAQTPLDTMMN
jgi:hypothetical protein